MKLSKAPRGLTSASLFLILGLTSASFTLHPSPASASLVNLSRAGSLAPLTNGLVGWWTLDGKDTNWATGVTNDMSGGGYNGQTTGLATSSAPILGKLGQAFSFNRSNSYVNLPAGAFGNYPTSGSTNSYFVTISLWFKTTTNGGILGQQAVPVGTNPTGWVPSVYVDNTGKLRASVFWHGATTNQIVSTASVNDGKWHHLVDTYRNGIETVYLDGALVNNQSASETGYSATYYYNLGVVYCAGWTNCPTAGWSYFGGAIDDARVYNRALTVQEVKQLYSSTSGSKQNVTVKVASTTSDTGIPNLSSGLVGWWTFDGKDIVNGVLKDRSVNNYSGNLVNISTSSFYVLGKIGQAGKFDGTDDQLNTNYTQTGVTAYTISTWIKTTDAGASKVFVHNRGSGAGKSLTLGIGTTGGGHGGAGKIGWELDSDGVDVGVSSVQTVNDDKWHHIVGTWAAPSGTTVAAGQFTIYIDGVAASLTTGSIGSVASPLTGLGATTFARHDPWTTNYNGLLDDVRIYNRALSAKEVLMLYTTGGGTKQNATIQAPLVSTSTGITNINTSLIGYWNLDGKNINWATGVVTDSSASPYGGGSNGIAMGMSTSSSPVMGRIGQALKFNGTNSYISIEDTGTVLDFNASSTYTWSSWLKFTGSVSDYKCYLSKDIGVKLAGFNLCFNQTNSIADLVICKYITGTVWGCSSGLSLNIPADGWNNITVTYNGITGNWVVYKNGNLMGTINFYVMSDLVMKYYIGAGNSGSVVPQAPKYFWNGSIDDVRIYNRTLSPAEIKQLYNMGR